MQNQQAHLSFNKESQLPKVEEKEWGGSLCHAVDSKENSVYKSEKKRIWIWMEQITATGMRPWHLPAAPSPSLASLSPFSFFIF